MTTQLQKPSVGKAKYSPEYKQEALEHWKDSGRSAACIGTIFISWPATFPRIDRRSILLALRRSRKASYLS